MTRRKRRSSGHWRKNQGQDVYFRRAKSEGYRARSAYKLLQIQDQFHILRGGQVVLDLGAAPGSWSQVAAKLVGARGKVISVDLLAFDPIPGVYILQGDITSPEVQTDILETAGGMVDVVLCDAAPNTSGIRDRDHALSIELVQAAFSVAQRSLKHGGHFVAKVFEGGDLPDLLSALRRCFDRVKPFHPQASRRESSELFIVCLEHRRPDLGS